MHRAVFVLFSLAVLVPSLYAWDVADATEFCFSIQNRRNQKDLYADPNDCHKYIQCFYQNETTAVGFTKLCQEGLFWHEDVLACMPEGETPCVDACLDQAMAAKGFYAGEGCRQFFKCSNTGSYGMCCPEFTAFNDETGNCDPSEECTDICVPVSPAVTTTVAAPEAINSTVCQDSFGSLVSTSPDEENAFFLVDDEGNPSTKLYCPTGYSFSLDTCRCDIENGAEAPRAAPARSAALYLAFEDGEAGDSAQNSYQVDLLSGAQLDSSSGAIGSGSLLVNGGLVEVPAFKNYDFRNHGSFAAFFRCDGACSGAIFSNRAGADDDKYTVAIGVEGNRLVGTLNFWDPVGPLDVGASFSGNGWHHVAVTYDSNAVVTYIDGVEAQTQFISGFLTTSQAPFTVGTDQVFGTFNGNIDDVLVAPFAMTADEVALHQSGDLGSLNLF